MKNAINITEKIKEGATLKKLAFGDTTIVGDEIVERTDDMKPVREIRDASTPGFFIRLNSNTLKHTFNGQLPNGSKFKIGDVFSMTVKEAKQKLADERDAFESKREAKRSVTPTERGTLRYCFGKWMTSAPKSKSSKFDPVTQSTAKKKSQKTIDQVTYWVERYTSDWMDDQIVDIDAADIRDRADEIASGKFLGDVKEVTQLKDGDLYNNAHHWLKSVSAVVSDTVEFHKSMNWFKHVLTKEYPARDGGHRRLTEEEIGFILNVSRNHFRITTTRRPDQVVKGRRREEGDLIFEAWRKMLMMKFQLLSGFRIGGVCDLKIEEINGVNIHRPSMDKTGRPHTLPITTHLRELLDECVRINAGKDDETTSNWPREVTKSEFLFCTGEGKPYSGRSKLFAAARNRLGNVYDLPKVKGERMRVAKEMTSHDLRVTLATVAKSIGISREQAKQFLGQSLPTDVFDRYDDVSESDRQIQFDDLTTALQAVHDELFRIAGNSTL